MDTKQGMYSVPIGGTAKSFSKGHRCKILKHGRSAALRTMVQRITISNLTVNIILNKVKNYKTTANIYCLIMC